ncbi:hypothetical protein [Streptomyces sp. NBC_01429]|uniref:hypothetical protein n=1 Tax=Streptomyces sp. NBC_01429 TaxID=2903862 RepID=UPI002E2A5ACD|nr:hypothetical protein [Streptomyces sp. NBC_01429]
MRNRFKAFLVTCAVVAPSLALAAPAHATSCGGGASSVGPISVTACVTKSLGKGTVSVRIAKSRDGERNLTVHWRYSISDRGKGGKPAGWVPQNWSISEATVSKSSTDGKLKGDIGAECLRLELFVVHGGKTGRTVSNYTCQKSV